MAEKTAIEWCDHTFNPWAGCTKVSPACDNCYAEADQKRFRFVDWGANAPRRRTSAAYWKEPLKWNAEAAKDGTRRKVFCASWADVFDNHRTIDLQWRLDLWDLILETPNLDWLLLTKRPQKAINYLPASWLLNGMPRNIWLGTTVENQAEADRRIPHLLDIPAVVRFLSCEPLLGPVDLTWISPSIYAATCNALTGVWRWDGGPSRVEGGTIDWVIAGGESGRDARPSHPDWFRGLRRQCHAAGTPFFFKQWGDWVSAEPAGQAPFWQFQDGRYIDGHHLPDIEEDDRWCENWATADFQGHAIFEKVGKKRAGRLLDGRQHDEFPRQSPECI